MAARAAATQKEGDEQMKQKMYQLYIASNVTVGVSFVLSLILHFLGQGGLAIGAAAVCVAAMVVGLVSLILRFTLK